MPQSSEEHCFIWKPWNVFPSYTTYLKERNKLSQSKLCVDVQFYEICGESWSRWMLCYQCDWIGVLILLLGIWRKWVLCPWFSLLLWFEFLFFLIFAGKWTYKTFHQFRTGYKLCQMVSCYLVVRLLLKLSITSIYNTQRKWLFTFLL